MKIINLLVIICSIVVLSSCQNAFNDRKDYKEVMEIHDLAMAEMLTMHELSKKLQDLKASADSTQLNKIIEAKNNLRKADDQMDEWMRQFHKPKNKDEYVTYLKNQLDKVKKVNKDIFSSIDNAKKIIEDHDQK